MAVVLTVSTARTESTVSHVTNKLITDANVFWEKLSRKPNGARNDQLYAGGAPQVLAL
jgi:hypothetical protein